MNYKISNSKLSVEISSKGGELRSIPVSYTHLSQEEKDFICRFAQEHADSLGKNEIEIQEMHNIVEGALERVNPAVAKSYRDYRNYKLDFIHMMEMCIRDRYHSSAGTQKYPSGNRKRIRCYHQGICDHLYHRCSGYHVCRKRSQGSNLYHHRAAACCDSNLFLSVLPDLQTDCIF